MIVSPEWRVVLDTWTAASFRGEKYAVCDTKDRYTWTVNIDKHELMKRTAVRKWREPVHLIGSRGNASCLSGCRVAGSLTCRPIKDFAR
nr:hypothetical protein [Paraburkholderia tropica]